LAKEGLISVTTGCFVAVAQLKHCCCRTEQSFLRASDEPLGPTNVKRQDVGHEGVITGRDGFSLRFPIINPQGVA